MTATHDELTIYKEDELPMGLLDKDYPREESLQIHHYFAVPENMDQDHIDGIFNLIDVARIEYVAISASYWPLPDDRPDFYETVFVPILLERLKENRKPQHLQHMTAIVYDHIESRMILPGALERQKLLRDWVDAQGKEEDTNFGRLIDGLLSPFFNPYPQIRLIDMGEMLDAPGGRESISVNTHHTKWGGISDLHYQCGIEPAKANAEDMKYPVNQDCLDTMNLSIVMLLLAEWMHG